MFNKRLIQELSEAKIYIYKQVLCQWIALISNVLLTIGLCYLFVQLINHQLSNHVLFTFLILSFVLLIIRAMSLKKAILFSFQGASFVKTTLRERLFDKIMDLGMQYLQYVSTSELVQLSVEGINQLETYFSLYLPQLFYSLLAPLTLFIVLVFFDFKSALILFICVPLIPLSIVIVQKIAKKLLSKYWSSYTALGDGFLENLQGLTTLKIYGSDQYQQEKMNEEAENFRKITMRVLIMQLNSISIMDIVAYGGAGLGSYFAISHYMSNQISLFAALLIALLSFEFFIPLRQLGSFFHIAMNGIAASDKIFHIFDSIVNTTKEKTIDNVTNIDISHMSFGYDEERMILEDISFSLKKNDFIGIVGESGSGKSTLAKLIMGYHDQYQGKILINNYQRYDINDTYFYEKFIYISNDPMIFKGTVRENLCFREVSDEKIWNVLEKVKLADFLRAQDGLDTMLLENGSNLSGGQKQRLNLARALLYDSEVYIFDEATSNIDVESEEMILSVIKELAHQKTIIMITHRLSNVIDCDQILVFDHGKIEESGNYDTLMNHKKLFYRLYTSQKELEVC